MTIVNFKNVGQGDSTIIEWEHKGTAKLGIIDCNLYNGGNPVLEYLSQKKISEIEFVILSHFHYDHFSGMPELFKFCYAKDIKIKRFLHTLSEHIFHIYKKIFYSKRVEKAVFDFFDYLELAENNILEDISVNYASAPIQLSDTLTLSFFAPNPKTGITIAKQLMRKVNKKEFKYSDINKFSTITQIQSTKSSVIFTSDAVRDCFRYLHTRIDKKVELIQAPHHGSIKNIYIDFWRTLQKTDNCPILFSVGYEPKDKLPDIETVEFLHGCGFNVHSTNSVFGINEYFNQKSHATNIFSNQTKSQYLNHFSKKKNSTYRYSRINSKYEGDQQFIVFQ